MSAFEKQVKKRKDHKVSHKSYSEAHEHKTAIHNALTEEGYKKGYHSADESPGVDHQPVMTHSTNYRHPEVDEPTARLEQTLHDKVGSGETRLSFEKSPTLDVGSSARYKL